MAQTDLIDTEIIVGGMECDNCALSVEEALENIPGVACVQVNLGIGHAIVSHAPGTASVAELTQSIVNAGFDFSGVV